MPAKSTATPEERFWSKVDKTGDCWVWRGGTGGQNNGYGRFWPTRRAPALAHRWSYESLVGPVPEGLVLDHLCRNRACVNPDHLEPVTRGENVLRGDTIPAINAAKTHCPRGHAYDEQNAYVTSKGFRLCRTCQALRSTLRRVVGGREGFTKGDWDRVKAALDVP